MRGLRGLRSDLQIRFDRPGYEVRRGAMRKNGKVTNIFLSGVGGQGTILASNILGEVFLNAGYDVKKAEVHGMAQRGGDVTTHFRFGKKVYINNQRILPPSVSLGQMAYPNDVEKTFKKYFKDNVHMIDGQEIARNL